MHLRELELGHGSRSLGESRVADNVAESLSVQTIYQLVRLVSSHIYIYLVSLPLPLLSGFSLSGGQDTKKAFVGSEQVAKQTDRQAGFPRGRRGRMSRKKRETKKNAPLRFGCGKGLALGMIADYANVDIAAQVELLGSEHGHFGFAW